MTNEAPQASGQVRVMPMMYAMLSILAVSYIALALFMCQLGFQFMRDDMVLYWQNSTDWTAAFNGLYAPLYLWILFLARTITLGVIPPIPMMMMINLACFLSCGWLIFRIGVVTGVSSKLSALGALLFGLWPLVGLPYTVFPKSDIPALALYLGGLYLLLSGRAWVGSLVIGIAMLAHNVLWPLGPLTVAAFWLSQQPRPELRYLVGLIGVAALPVALLLVAGAVVTGSFLWTLSGNMLHITPLGSLPVLEGGIGTFLRGGLAEIAKGLFLAGLGVFAAGLAYVSYRRKTLVYPVGIAICLVIVALWFVLNSFEIWGMARFSRLLALPFLWVASSYFENGLPDSRGWNAVSAAVLTGLILSQFVYAWYMVKVFYA